MIHPVETSVECGAKQWLSGTNKGGVSLKFSSRVQFMQFLELSKVTFSYVPDRLLQWMISQSHSTVVESTNTSAFLAVPCVVKSHKHPRKSGSFSHFWLVCIEIH